jgi:GT2 family glycosyltransferase
MDDPVTIIVPTINARPDLLQACISECERTMRDGDALLVVEGGTFAENCNGGAALTEAPTIIFLNDDCKADDDDWIDRLLQPFTDPRVGIVGARLIYPNGHLQHTGIYFETDDFGRLHGANRKWDSPSGPVDAVTGACLAVRTQLFRDLDGFDPIYRNGNEDIDFCLRARQAGHTIWYQADCTVIHHESQSGPARWQHVQENVQLFNERWSVTTSD